MEVYYQQNKNLWDAARDNLVGQAGNLLEQGHNIDEPSSEGLTPLMYACTYGSTEAALYLIEQGADVDAAHPEDRINPLMLAVVDGHNEIAKALVNQGANLNARDKDGNDASFYACLHGDPELYGLVEHQDIIIDDSNASGDTRLIIAAKEGQSAMAEYLLKRKANVNKTDIHGNSPLILAAGRGFSSLVELFLRYDPDLQQVNNLGQNALMKSLMYGHRKIAELLIPYYGDLTKQDHYSNTLLHYAVCGGNKRMVEKIAGLNKQLVRVRNGEGFSPFELAEWQGNSDLLEVLKS